MWRLLDVTVQQVMSVSVHETSSHFHFQSLAVRMLCIWFSAVALLHNDLGRVVHTFVPSVRQTFPVLHSAYELQLIGDHLCGLTVRYRSAN